MERDGPARESHGDAARQCPTFYRLGVRQKVNELLMGMDTHSRRKSTKGTANSVSEGATEAEMYFQRDMLFSRLY